MQGQDNDHYVNLKIYDFIQLNPSTILNIYHNERENRLFVTR